MTHIINAAGALIITACSIALYKKMPALWLCEYDEYPEEMHLPGFRDRMKPLQKAAVPAVLWALVFTGLQLRAGGCGGFLWRTPASGPALLSVLPVMILLVTAALSDAAYRILPDQLVAGAAFFAAAVRCAAAGAQGFAAGGGLWAAAAAVPGVLWDCGLGAAAGGFLMLLCILCGLLTGGRVPLGAGDVRLMIACGAAGASAEAAFSVFCGGMLLSGVYMAAGILSGKLSPGNSIALGPFLVLAALPCL